jgi:hypothetical protein
MSFLALVVAVFVALVVAQAASTDDGRGGRA